MTRVGLVDSSDRCSVFGGSSRVAVAFVLTLAACGGSGARPASGGEATDVVVPEPTENTEAEPEAPAPAVRSHPVPSRQSCDSDPAPADTARAKEIFKQGMNAFGEGRYAEAATLFSDSYELSCAPALLFNIATAHERNGDRDKAIEAFELYLERTPDGPNSDMVEERLKKLRGR